MPGLVPGSHGFLLAPALAELTLAYVERGAIDNEVMQCS
jgi:glycine oxidase